MEKKLSLKNYFILNEMETNQVFLKILEMKCFPYKPTKKLITISTENLSEILSETLSENFQTTMIKMMTSYPIQSPY